jgi:hypothetical protein
MLPRRIAPRAALKIRSAASQPFLLRSAEPACAHSSLYVVKLKISSEDSWLTAKHRLHQAFRKHREPKAGIAVQAGYERTAL